LKLLHLGRAPLSLENLSFLSFKQAAIKLHVRLLLASVLAAAAGLTFSTQALAQTDPLPSWNDGLAKQAIVNFVQTTTDKSSAGFVPQEERIATFDQDGTLWVEHPMYTQVALLPEPGGGGSEGKAGARERRAVQNRAVW